MHIDKVDFTLDPTGHYEANAGEDWQERVINALGILPQFMLGPHSDLATNMEKAYQFHMGWTLPESHGATVENECFCFPGDPPQYPLMKATQGGETVYVYPCAVVAQVVEGKLIKWTRMD